MRVQLCIFGAKKVWSHFKLFQQNIQEKKRLKNDKSVPRNEEKNTKNNGKNNRVFNKIIEILSKICFVYNVIFVRKEVLSSKISQINYDLMRKGFHQVISMGCLNILAQSS